MTKTTEARYRQGEREDFRVHFDDQPNEVVDRVNDALRRHGLSIVDDGEPHEGFMLYQIVGAQRSEPATALPEARELLSEWTRAAFEAFRAEVEDLVRPEGPSRRPRARSRLVGAAASLARAVAADVVRSAPTPSDPSARTGHPSGSLVDVESGLAFMTGAEIEDGSEPQVDRGADEPSDAELWFGRLLRAYAVFCRSIADDASRSALASAIDESLVAWSRGAEPSAAHRAAIEAWVTRGDVDAVVAPALVALFEQIEAGGRPARVAPDASLGRLGRLQRRILETWAGEVRPRDPRMAVLLVGAAEGRALTADDRDVLEAWVGAGPRGAALRRALEHDRSSRGGVPR